MLCCDSLLLLSAPSYVSLFRFFYFIADIMQKEIKISFILAVSNEMKMYNVYIECNVVLVRILAHCACASNNFRCCFLRGSYFQSLKRLLKKEQQYPNEWLNFICSMLEYLTCLTCSIYMFSSCLWTNVAAELNIYAQCNSMYTCRLQSRLAGLSGVEVVIAAMNRVVFIRSNLTGGIIFVDKLFLICSRKQCDRKKYTV